MKKDAYYFPHFSNARNDSKLVKLRRVMGIEGYGMYFLILEVLREQTEFKLPLSYLEDLAYDWHTSKEKLLTIVTNFELFDIIDDMFFSTKLILYLQPYLEKSERARVAANIRWQKVKSMQMHTKHNANALQEDCGSNASKIKESKEKENKYIIPDEIKNFTASLVRYFPKEIIDKLTKTNKLNLIDTIDKLIRLDKYSKNQIETAVKNGRNDNFWNNNFLSLNKLRKLNKDDVKFIDVFLQITNTKINVQNKEIDKYSNFKKY